VINSKFLKEDVLKALRLKDRSSDVLLPIIINNAANPPRGLCAVYLDFIYLELSPPLHPFLKLFLGLYCISLCQFVPNVITFIVSYLLVCCFCGRYLISLCTCTSTSFNKAGLASIIFKCTMIVMALGKKHMIMASGKSPGSTLRTSRRRRLLAFLSTFLKKLPT